MFTNSGRLHRLNYKTRFGNGTLVWSGGMLLAHILPGLQGIADVRQGRPVADLEPMNDSALPCSQAAFCAAPEPVEPVTHHEQQLVNRLESYFNGARIDFSRQVLPLKRPVTTPFRASVLAALAAVPHGETISYSGLAAAAGHPRAFRAVGNLLAANPWPVIIPCHRVIRGDGSPGNFSAGEVWKRRLLELENCPSTALANTLESR